MKYCLSTPPLILLIKTLNNAYGSKQQCITIWNIDSSSWWWGEINNISCSALPHASCLRLGILWFSIFALTILNLFPFFHSTTVFFLLLLLSTATVAPVFPYLGSLNYYVEMSENKEKCCSISDVPLGSHKAVLSGKQAAAQALQNSLIFCP